MPQATPELRARWADDWTAIAQLGKNFDCQRGMLIAKPGYIATPDDLSALDYLFQEWDYAYQLNDEQPSDECGKPIATDEMIDAACAAVPGLYRVDAMRAIEAALGQTGCPWTTPLRNVLAKAREALADVANLAESAMRDAGRCGHEYDIEKELAESEAILGEVDALLASYAEQETNAQP